MEIFKLLTLLIVPFFIACVALELLVKWAINAFAEGDEPEDDDCNKEG